MIMNKILKIIVVMIAIFLFSTSISIAKEFSISGQAKMILKITSYDENIEQRILSDTINIGIVAHKSNEDLIKKTKELESYLLKFKRVKISGLNFKTFNFIYDDAAEIDDFIKSSGISVLYIMKGNDQYITTIYTICRKNRILSLTNSVEYVKKGISIGFEINSTGKLEIYSNINSIKKEKISFSSGLLMIAKVVGDK